MHRFLRKRPSTPLVRMLLRAGAVGALALAAACADSTSAPVRPAPEVPDAPGDPSLVRLACTADVAARTVRCDTPGTAGGLRADRIYGAGTAMKLTSSNIAIAADSFTFDMTVTNNLEYPVGTTDGANPDPNGIRAFFVDGIHTTQGTGTVTVANADGIDAFTAAGQAYFAYPGVLQPGATTAARKWKLRFDPGVEQFSFGLYISTPVPPGGGTVGLTILAPKPDTVASDSVVVRVRIDSSPASIQSVKAYLADRVVALTPYAAGQLRGTFQLAGLPFGAHQIRVHAVTVRADTGNAFVTLQKDAPPTLVVAAPASKWVARPNLRVDADCIDDNPAGCTRIALIASGGTVLASGTTGLHTDVSLAAYDGGGVGIRIEADDSRGRRVSTTMEVAVQSGLTAIDSAGTQALDVDAGRLLYAGESSGVYLRDRQTGVRTLLRNYAGATYSSLHSQGAIFYGGGGYVFDWRNGTLVSPPNNFTLMLAAKGDWATWVSATNVILRNLSTGESAIVATTQLSAAAARDQSQVAANGDLVFQKVDGSSITLQRIRGGVTTPIPGSTGGSSPLTDGINIAYLRSSQVILWDGTAETVLSNTLTSPRPHTHYEVNGGWVAYTVVDGGGATQLRVRAPGGTDRQVTTYGTASQIRALSAEGTLVFANGFSLYVLRAPFTTAPTRIASDRFASVRFRGTELQLYVGNTVFTTPY